MLNFLRSHHPECWSPADSEQYAQDSAYDAKHGSDPNHLPTLDELGLGFLLDQNAVTHTPHLSGTYLAEFTGTPNPFTRETKLTYGLNRMAYVTVAIYDELGRMVWGDGKGRSLDAGTHTIRIDGTGLSSGTLYARISTGFGEVKTVKLVHQGP